MGQLRILSQRIINGTAYLGPRRCDRGCPVNGVRLPILIADVERELDPWERYSNSVLARAYQLRRLYQLFGRNPTTR